MTYQQLSTKVSHERNRMLGRRIQKYNQGNEEYRKRYKSQYTKTRKELAVANTALVKCIAREYQRKGISLDDLIGEGYIGLMRATKDYNPNHNPEKYPNGIEFTTYAEKWIRQAITRSFQGFKTIALPNYISSQSARIRESIMALSHALGREPTNQEIASYFNKTFFPNKLKKHLKEFQIEGFKLTGKTHFSIPRMKMNGESYDPFPSHQKTPLEELSYQNELEKLMILLNNGVLDEREKQVLRLYFGLDKKTPLTLKEVGLLMNCTKERIRQIQKEALEKLKEKMICEE